eukprot:541910-Pyramimonas_sp.AAC.1
MEGPFWVESGVVAGCSMATSFIRVFALAAFDHMSAGLAFGTDFDACIDDACLSRTGTVPEVVEALVSSSVSLHKAVTQELGCTLALDKVGGVCSHKFVAIQLEGRLGELRGKPSASAVNL